MSRSFFLKTLVNRGNIDNSKKIYATQIPMPNVETGNILYVTTAQSIGDIGYFATPNVDTPFLSSWIFDVPSFIDFTGWSVMLDEVYIQFLTSSEILDGYIAIGIIDYYNARNYLDNPYPSLPASIDEAISLGILTDVFLVERARRIMHLKDLEITLDYTGKYTGTYYWETYDQYSMRYDLCVYIGVSGPYYYSFESFYFYKKVQSTKLNTLTQILSFTIPQLYTAQK